MQIFVQIQYESLHVDMNSPEGDVDIPSLFSPVVYATIFCWRLVGPFLSSIQIPVMSKLLDLNWRQKNKILQNISIL